MSTFEVAIAIVLTIETIINIALVIWLKKIKKELDTKAPNSLNLKWDAKKIAEMIIHLRD